MQVIGQCEYYLNALFEIGSVKREKAIQLFTKIVSKIILFPDDDKYKSLNHSKISQKFDALGCSFVMKLLFIGGFIVDGDRLKLRENNTEFVLNQLNQRIKIEKQRLEQERLTVIQNNTKRLNTKSNFKKKQLKDKILSAHKEQMHLAKQGIYNVKATVSDRKGTGTGVNSL